MDTVNELTVDGSTTTVLAIIAHDDCSAWTPFLVLQRLLLRPRAAVVAPFAYDSSHTDSNDVLYYETSESTFLGFQFVGC